MSDRMRRVLRWFGLGFGILAVLAVIGGLAGWRWMHAALPPQYAEIQLAGITGSVGIRRLEVDGIPIISAANELDAFFALGWVHAEDRLWQMDFQRRVASGRLSEVLGARTLEIDKLMRTLGLAGAAESGLQQVSPPMLAVLEAYAAGVNSWIEHHPGPLPPEFLILGYRPEPWRPVDTILWGRLMALNLSDNFYGELARSRIASVLTPKELARLFPHDEGRGPISIDSAALESAKRLAASLPNLDDIPGQGAGASNAWVISGSRTKTGKPILANDPHLGFSVPILWYLARIETPELTLAGATAPGVPAVLIGHNGHIAWGLTTTHSDTQDLFIERLVGDDRYASPNGPLPFAMHTQRIEVKGADPVEIIVRQTRHGPVISDASKSAAGIAGAGHAIALAWPALRSDDATAEAVLRLNRARNWTEFREALRYFHSPQQNIFYADVDGHIGMVAPARVPIRPTGDDGRLPVEGWSGAHDWIGFIPFEELPQSFEPPSGRIVNANNRIVPKSYPYLIAAEWEAPYRAQSIEEALDAGMDGTADQSQSLQHGIVSLAARELVPLVTGYAPRNGRQSHAIRLLSGWDFRMRADRPEPLIFSAWLIAMTETVFADELGEAFDAFLGWRADTLQRVLASDPIWCDDRRTATLEDCEAQILLALDMSLDWLIERLGSDIDGWRWGDLHQVRFAHPAFSSVPVMGWLFDRRVEEHGDFYTALRAVPRIRGDGRFTAVHGAGLRA
ncbi:MAG TPA: penicillin acylase family protein, partial [Alphaproteobacteria bacterium]|nr:penicillin acylase family protein [Alphaproteobacteria bacterium]